jgi:prophage regulatory protein
MSNAALETPRPPRLLKLPELMIRLSISRSESYRRIHDDPTFPKPVVLGVRAVGFVEEEVDAYVRALIARRDVRTTRPATCE